MKSLIRMVRLFPNALELWHLKWAMGEMGALHPDLPSVVLRINLLESKS